MKRKETPDSELEVEKDIDITEKKEVSDQIVISSEIKLEVKQIVNHLKDLLKDNKEFAKTLIEKILLGKKGPFWGEIEALFDHEYSNLDKHGDFRTDLSKTVYILSKIVIGQHKLVRDEMIKTPREEWKPFENNFFKKVTEIINDEFYTLDQNPIIIDISGESPQVDHINN